MTRLPAWVSLSALASLAWALLCTEPARSQERAREVQIGASGDALLHQKVLLSAGAHGWPSVFAGLREVIDDDELAFVNLETPLTTEIIPIRTGSPPILGAPPAAAQALADAGIDLVACANNHAYDQRSRGAMRTLEALDQAAIRHAGIRPQGEDPFAPIVITRAGATIAFFSVTESLNTGPGLPRLTEIAHLDDEGARRLEAQLRAIRPQVDLVVLAVHWSNDYVPHPRAGQRRRARAWVDLGADLILGSGPHVLQTVERVDSPRGEAIIAYSLGNVVSNQGQVYLPGRRASQRVHPGLRLATTRDGAWLRARFSIDGARIGVRALSAVPLWTENNFWQRERSRPRIPHAISVIPLREASDATQRDRRQAIESALGPAVTLTP